MTAAKKLTDEEFLEAVETVGLLQLSKRTGMNHASLQKRRQRLEAKLGRTIISKNSEKLNAIRGRMVPIATPKHLPLDIRDGTVLIASDCHYWPGVVSTAHLAFLHFCKLLKPKAVIMNGDVLDGASISRHAPNSWVDVTERPKLVDEIEACRERLAEIEKAAPGAERIWTLGNHDSRFAMRLAVVAPEFAQVHGTELKDHFPQWRPCWQVWINRQVVVKHRFKGGIHATHNNTVAAGMSYVTGHLHSLKVTPYTDLTGTRFGVDTGTLADPYGPQFEYTEGAPANNRSGFAVLTFRNGRLMWPELVHVFDPDGRRVEFRGEVIQV